MEANHYHKMLWIVGCQRGRHVYFKGLPHYGNPPNHCRTQLIDHKVWSIQWWNHRDVWNSGDHPQSHNYWAGRQQICPTSFFQVPFSQKLHYDRFFGQPPRKILKSSASASLMGRQRAKEMVNDHIFARNKDVFLHPWWNSHKQATPGFWSCQLIKNNQCSPKGCSYTVSSAQVRSTVSTTFPSGGFGDHQVGSWWAWTGYQDMGENSQHLSSKFNKLLRKNYQMYWFHILKLIPSHWLYMFSNVDSGIHLWHRVRRFSSGWWDCQIRWWPQPDPKFPHFRDFDLENLETIEFWVVCWWCFDVFLIKAAVWPLCTRWLALLVEWFATGGTPVAPKRLWWQYLDHRHIWRVQNNHTWQYMTIHARSCK